MSVWCERLLAEDAAALNGREEEEEEEEDEGRGL